MAAAAQAAEPAARARRASPPTASSARSRPTSSSSAIAGWSPTRARASTPRPPSATCSTTQASRRASCARGIDAAPSGPSRGEARAGRAQSFGLAAGVSQATLDAIAACESGGDPTAVNAAGYYGKYQFDTGTWASVGGSGNPAEASEAEQDYRASLLYSRAGSSPWPVCGA